MGTAGQAPGGQMEQMKTAGEVLLWEVEGMQRGQNVVTRREQGAIRTRNGCGQWEACRHLQRPHQPAPKTSHRCWAPTWTETRATVVSEVSAMARPRAQSIPGPLTLALKWTGLCYSTLSDDPQPKYHPGATQISRILGPARATSSHSACPNIPPDRQAHREAPP